MAVLTRIDIVKSDGREWKDAAITYHKASEYRKGWQFNCFQIDIAGEPTLFLPTEALELMSRLVTLSKASTD